MHPLNFSLSITPLNIQLSSNVEDILTRSFFSLAHKEVKIGISSFDDKYFIRSTDPKQAHIFLQDSQCREAIGYLFNKNFMYIKADKKT
jgi:hypothetical protein